MKYNESQRRVLAIVDANGKAHLGPVNDETKREVSGMSARFLVGIGVLRLGRNEKLGLYVERVSRNGKVNG